MSVVPVVIVCPECGEVVPPMASDLSDLDAHVFYAHGILTISEDDLRLADGIIFEAERPEVVH
jgi:hypothetical protein